MKTLDIPVMVRVVMLAGIVLSIACMVIGLLMLLGHPAQVAPDGANLSFYLTCLLRRQPLGFLFLGLAILALTPLLGLLVQVVGFGQRREYMFACAALLVFLITVTALLFNQ